jgi:hypothetical protein
MKARRAFPLDGLERRHCKTPTRPEHGSIDIANRLKEMPLIKSFITEDVQSLAILLKAGAPLEYEMPQVAWTTDQLDADQAKAAEEGDVAAYAGHHRGAARTDGVQRPSDSSSPLLSCSKASSLVEVEERRVEHARFCRYSVVLLEPPSYDCHGPGPGHAIYP